LKGGLLINTNEVQISPVHDLSIVDGLFRQLLEKFNKVENKKYLYKDIDELTVIEIDTILVIGRDELKSMSAIAKKLGVSFGTPTVTIDRLIDKGYVQRIRDLGDRRQVFIKLSEKGLEVYESIVKIKTRLAEKVFGILTPDERTRFVNVLSRLNQNFDELFSGL
jgi:DNA-binding MarR family transcriptional regulator